MVGDNLPQGWKWVTLEQVQHPDKRAIVSGPFGSNIGSRFFVSSGIPVIRGNNLTADMTRYIDDGYVFLTEDKAMEFRNCEAYANDLVFTAAGTLGQLGIIPPDAKFPRYIISNRQMRARVDENVILPLYAYYWLASPEMVEYINQRNTGSSVPLINLSVLRQLPIPLAPITEQKAIIRILGALDDKIELNRRMNRTLEAIAQALFKSWFVDFDPVTAKAKGRQPYGRNAETAVLFPERFQDSELGPIPAGWEITSLGSVLDIVKGRSYLSSELQESDTAMVTLKSIERGGGYRPDGLKPFIGKYKPEQVLKSGELVVACTDITQNADVVGRPAIIPADNRYKTLVASLDLHILRLRDPNISIPFLFNLLQTEDYTSHIVGHANGTTVLHLSKEGIPTYLFAKPPALILQAYTRFAEPVYKKIETNRSEAVTLTAIRNGLLPRLLSGELRVRKAEKVIENIE